jgi:membrane-associated protease RseP (regulator of RpoE activity)
MSRTSRWLLVALVALLSGCASWVWRVPSLRYGAGPGTVAVHSDRILADLPPESYAIGSAEEEGTDPDDSSARIARAAQRHGADVVLLGKQEAVVSSWTTVRSESGVGRHETGRQETLNVESARVFALGIGYRSPEQCIGVHLVCEPTVAALADAATCVVRVRAMVPNGPASAAGIGEGEGLVAIDGHLVASPSDIHQRVDAASGDVVIEVQGELARRAVRVTPTTCAEMYPNAG